MMGDLKVGEIRNVKRIDGIYLSLTDSYIDVLKKRILESDAEEKGEVTIVYNGYRKKFSFRDFLILMGFDVEVDFE